MEGENFMKKSSFVALVLGTVSGVLFSLGMCMALVSEWGQLTFGIIFGAVGLVLGLVTVLIWRKMENKEPIKLNAKTVLLCLYITAALLILGLGMCFCLVWDSIVIGTLIGLVGIVMLLMLIPMLKGLK